MIVPFSVELEPCFFEHVGDLFADLVADLAPNAASEFLNFHNRTVGGTDEIVCVVSLDAASLDTKLRAALRAAGFELPDRGDAHNESSHGCFDTNMIGPEAAGVKSTASDLENRTKRLFGEGV